ncbi:unnamed protein product, partial [Parnassius mnemosyne]
MDGNTIGDTKLLPKLNDEHVMLGKIKKMKVKNCVRVLSHKVAQALNFAANFSHDVHGNKVSQTLRNTASTILLFDKLFDSVNGASTSHKYHKGKNLRKAVTATSEHHTFWQDAIKKLNEMKFVDLRGRESSVPSIKNWIVTIKSLQRLWQFFNEKNVKIMRPRYFNTDPIENFFGQVRAYNFRNNDPDCYTFANTFKTLLITGFIKFHNPTFNCEDDEAAPLLKLKNLFEKISGGAVKKILDTSNINFNCCRPENIQTAARQERLNVYSQAYTAGWVIRKVLKETNNCSLCKANFTVQNEEEIHSWISIREYEAIKLKKMTYPAEHAVTMFGLSFKESSEYLELYPQENNISKNIKEKIVSKYSFDFLSCQEHPSLEYFLGLTIRLAVYNWCYTVNKILKGTDVLRLEGKNLPPMTKKALVKFK